MVLRLANVAVTHSVINADYILLYSTIKGLQGLINIATDYVNQFGLRFNTAKTICMTMGGNMLAKLPQWYIDNVELDVKPTITYLGTVGLLGGMNGNAHCEARSRAAHKSFYALQGPGIKFPGVSPEDRIKLYNMAVSEMSDRECPNIEMHICISE